MEPPVSQGQGNEGASGTSSQPIDTGRNEHLVHVRYEDLLRTIGGYIDQHGLTDVLVTQIPNGVLLKGTVIEQRQGSPVERITAIMFSNDEIIAMLEESASRRDKTGPLGRGPQ